LGVEESVGVEEAVEDGAQVEAAAVPVGVVGLAGDGVEICGFVKDRAGVGDGRYGSPVRPVEVQMAVGGTFGGGRRRVPLRPVGGPFLLGEADG
jgi:hypothetical protein